MDRGTARKKRLSPSPGIEGVWPGNWRMLQDLLFKLLHENVNIQAPLRVEKSNLQ